MKQTIYLLGISLILFFMPQFSYAQVDFDMDDLRDNMAANAAERGDNPGTGGSGQDRAGGGGGGSNIAIFSNLPAQSKLTKDEFILEWRSSTVDGPYIAEIRSTGTNPNIVFAAVTNKKAIEIPLYDLHVEVGKSYTVSVRSFDGVKTSESSTIMIASEEDYEAALNVAKGKEEFASAPMLNKLLMKALALELNGFVNAAAQLYRTPVETDQEYLMLADMRNNFIERVWTVE